MITVKEEHSKKSQTEIKSEDEVILKELQDEDMSVSQEDFESADKLQQKPVKDKKNEEKMLPPPKVAAKSQIKETR